MSYPRKKTQAVIRHEKIENSSTYQRDEFGLNGGVVVTSADPFYTVFDTSLALDEQEIRVNIQSVSADSQGFVTYTLPAGDYSRVSIGSRLFATDTSGDLNNVELVIESVDNAANTVTVYNPDGIDGGAQGTARILPPFRAIKAVFQESSVIATIDMPDILNDSALATARDKGEVILGGIGELTLTSGSAILYFE